jgi:hypothetical protein
MNRFNLQVDASAWPIEPHMMMAVPIPSKVQMAAMSSKMIFIVLSPLADNMFYFCSSVNKIKIVVFQ